MTIAFLFTFCLFCAAVPAAMFQYNGRLFRRAPRAGSRTSQSVSVLIPARNEERTIAAAVFSILASTNVELECVVLDDASTDKTAAIVREMGRKDSRVRLESAPVLPAGWCGKQHACHLLSLHAAHDMLCFVDADVRLSSDALARMVAFLHASGASLVSGFPRQQAGTWLEKLLLPLIHFVLLGFLPIGRMRRSVSPAYAAACGQLMMVRREAYRSAGGHGSIRASLHDGLQLPTSFRRSGFRTDIFDATDVAVCRMYSNAAEVWSGLAKNATEGMASAGRILPFTLMLLLGQVVPLLLALWYPTFWALVLLGWLPRVQAAIRFRQSITSALLHPVGISILLAIQWYAFVRKVLRKPSGWKNRVYAQL